MHSFYSTDKFFINIDNTKYIFKTIVFDTLKLYIFMYLRSVPHPTAFVTHLWVHGMYVCTYVCMCEPDMNLTDVCIVRHRSAVLNSAINWYYYTEYVIDE